MSKSKLYYSRDTGEFSTEYVSAEELERKQEEPELVRSDEEWRIEETKFMRELSALLNKYSKETNSNTPDFILANYLERCLLAWSLTIRERDQWYAVDK